jgi:hypothetical protein
VNNEKDLKTISVDGDEKSPASTAWSLAVTLKTGRQQILMLVKVLVCTLVLSSGIQYMHSV